MKFTGFLLLALSLGCLVGCGQSEIGKAESDAEFPKQDLASVEAELAKEGKLDEYKAAQARDREYEARGRQSQNGQAGAPEGPAGR